MRQNITPMLALLLVSILPLTGCAPDNEGRATSSISSEARASVGTSSPSRLAIAEVSLGLLPGGVTEGDLVVSDDHRHIGVAASIDNRWSVMVDGISQGDYDDVRGLKFSPNSLRVAFVARRGNSQFLVLDGVEQRAYAPTDRARSCFSPNSQRVAYSAQLGESAVMVIDGVEGNQYPSLEWDFPSFVFSADSRKFAYIAKVNGQQWAVVVDGVEEPSFDKIEYTPLFSPDSKHVAYLARDQQGVHVVVDGKVGVGFSSISGGSTQFSPDSNHLAYWAYSSASTKVVVVDAKPETEYDNVECLSFSPDSSLVAYVAETEGQQFVVVNGTEKKRYRRIQFCPEFSADSKHLMYAGWTGKQYEVVLDDEVVGTHGIVTSPVFSPDSRRWAYAAATSVMRSWTVICDGENGARHSVGDVIRTKIAFSPDSHKVAYSASQGRAIEFVVVNGVRSENFSLVEPSPPIFSSDSKHVAFWALPIAAPLSESPEWTLVVDGRCITGLGEPLLNAKLSFNDSNHLYGLVRRGNAILRLEVGISRHEPE